MHKTARRLTEDADYDKKKFISSDKAHFDLGGHVNKRNCCIWGIEKHWKADTPKTSHCLVRRRILVAFGFKRTAPGATQPKLHSMFCALFLKIPLSAAELMAFSHLGAAFWYRWTIIRGVPSEISVTPTSQRQLTRLSAAELMSFSHHLNMCKT